MKPSLRGIPAVGRILDALGETGLPRRAVVAAVRRKLASLRSGREIPGFEETLADVRSEIALLWSSRIRPVINGTGIIIHTNLGRAPLAPEVVETLCSIGGNYNNLEYDIATGERGNRASYVEHNLALLCQAEAATVVNNCAAALVLILKHFTAARPEVIISRSELIQIGGGFRIPDILEASGARLREVGTTNKTSLADYAKAVTSETAMILKVHRSNFFMGGFVDSPPTEEIASLAQKKKIPFVEDLGSGAVVATDEIAEVEREPTPAEILKRGVDLVCFSGDKLLGGPQAGIIAGKAKWIARLKREPFFRALRCDKLILSALQTTADLYLDRSEAGWEGKTGQKTPVAMPALAMLGLSQDELRARGEKIVAGLSGLPLKASLGTGRGEIGGGTLPRSIIPSVVVELVPEALALSVLASRLRQGETPVIGYISGNRFKLDLRTIFPRQDEEVIRAIRAALG
jgi:L-seryl-tRNA(Ser) seleniumtransferase